MQFVGRVMRRAKGKESSYVILSVVIPTGIEPHEALNDNRTYRVVWGCSRRSGFITTASTT